jgi:D-galactarolactone cycloisomerase
VLAPHVLGKNPLDVERLYDRLYDVGRATCQTIVPLPAVSGIDIAMWDLAGKLHGVPTSTLLGGRRRESVRPYATGHYFKPVPDLDEQYDRICEEAQGNANAFGAVKLKVGLELLGYGFEEDVELVRRVREAVSSKTTVMVDANYAYDRRDARRVGRELEAVGVEWFEEPVRPEDVAGYADLRETLDVPVAGGECHTPSEFDRLFDAHALDVAQPDACIVGGLTPARRIATRAHDHGIPVVPHVWGTAVAIGAGLQLLATLDGRPWLEVDRSSNPLREELAVEPFAAEDREVPIPDAPGLGVSLDTDAIDRYRV